MGAQKMVFVPSKEGFSVLSYGKVVSQIHDGHPSDKLLACTFFAMFPAGLPVCDVQFFRVPMAHTCWYSLLIWAATLLGKSI